MAIAYVQSANHSIGEASASSSVATFGSNVGTGGRLLIVSAFWYSNNVNDALLSDVSTVTDTLGTAFTNVAFAKGTGVDTHWGIATWYGIAPSNGGADTITVTWIASTAVVRICITEVSGNDTVAPFDQTNSATASGTTAVNSGNVTTTANGELIYAFAQLSGLATLAAGTNESFTKREDFDAVDRSAMETAVQTTAGITSGQFTAGTNAGSFCQVVTFKPQATLGTDEDFWSVPIVQPQISTVSIW